ncbi:MAG: prenyltransferase/squalene oxidase repeat-containing protein [Gemmataceae bacterium]
MIRHLIAFLFICMLPGLLPVTSSSRSAAPEPTVADVAVEKGLAFLRSSQNPDGSWSSGPVANGNNRQRAGWVPANLPPISRNGHPVITAVAVMAFLSCGKVPGEGKDGAVVERGVKYVLSRQKPNGLIVEPNDGSIEMYSHGICTLMLAEVVGMTSGRTAEELRKKLELAVRVILQGQRQTGVDAGGWRYRVQGLDADLSVTGWQLLALRAAKNVGCDVPAEKIRKAVEYVRRCYDPDSQGFRYQVNGPVTIPCTGTGILALELCGKEYHRCEEVLRGGDFILRNPLAVNRQHFFYGVYYTSQGMFQIGGNSWTTYRESLHQLLLNELGPTSDGSWTGRGGWDDDRYGPNYCTAMAILSLAVEYRFLPIYQRFEEPVERDANDP